MKKIFSIIFMTVLITGLGCARDNSENVEELLRELKNPNIMVKREAIHRIGRLKIKEALPDLISLLNEGSDEIELEVLEILGNIGDTVAVRPLMTQLYSTNPLVREKGVEALGKIGDSRAVPAIVSILEQRDGRGEAEVLTAIWALGNIGEKSAIPVLAALFEENNDKYIRYNAGRALKKISVAEVRLVELPHTIEQHIVDQSRETTQFSKSKVKAEYKHSPSKVKESESKPGPQSASKEGTVKRLPTGAKSKELAGTEPSQSREEKARTGKPTLILSPKLTKKKIFIVKGESIQTLLGQRDTGAEQSKMEKKGRNQVGGESLEGIENETAIVEEIPVHFNNSKENSKKPGSKATLIAQAWFADEMGPYTVHVDFKKYDESAKEMALTLKKLGYQVYIRKMDIAGRGIRYRVVIGGFQDEAAAEKAAKKLRKEYGLFFVRVLPTSYIFGIRR